MKKQSYDAAIQKEALIDMQGAICNHLPKPMPMPVCSAYNSASTISNGIIAGIFAIIAMLRLF